MENISPSIVLFGAVLIMNVVLATGLQMYSTMATSLTDSISTMSVQMVEAFNSNFVGYEGKQTGSQISALVGRLIANAKTYADEEDKVPHIVCEKIAESYTTSVDAVYNNNVDEYINEITKIKNYVENKHTYTVSFEYGNSGIIEKITIEY